MAKVPWGRERNGWLVEGHGRPSARRGSGSERRPQEQAGGSRVR